MWDRQTCAEDSPESEPTMQKTKEDLLQSTDDVSTGTGLSTPTRLDTPMEKNAVVVNFQPGEPADPHNWSQVRFFTFWVAGLRQAAQC